MRSTDRVSRGTGQTVTHRLLGFARRMEPMEERVNINDILDESIDFLENDARYRNIDIQTNYAPDLPLTTTRTTQLQQVFLNIINNAIDAIGKDGEITINTRYIMQSNRIFIRSATPAREFPRRCCRKSSTPFSPPRRWARAPAWVYPFLTALSKSWAAESWWPARKAPAPRSPFIYRSNDPRRRWYGEVQDVSRR